MVAGLIGQRGERELLSFVGAPVDDHRQGAPARGGPRPIRVIERGGEIRGDIERAVGAGTVTQLEQVLDEPQLRADHQLQRHLGAWQRQHLAPVVAAGPGPGWAHQRDAPTPQGGCEPGRVAPPSGDREALLRQRSSLVGGVGEDQRESQLGQDRYEQVDIVGLQPVECGAQQPGPLGIGELGAHAASTTADEDEGRAGDGVGQAVDSREGEGVFEGGARRDGFAERPLGSAHADERLGAPVRFGGHADREREVLGGTSPCGAGEDGVAGDQ